jgi:hypothetical protein
VAIFFSNVQIKVVFGRDGWVEAHKVGKHGSLTMEENKSPKNNPKETDLQTT